VAQLIILFTIVYTVGTVYVSLSVFFYTRLKLYRIALLHAGILKTFCVAKPKVVRYYSTCLCVNYPIQ